MDGLTWVTIRSYWGWSPPLIAGVTGTSMSAYLVITLLDGNESLSNYDWAVSKFYIYRIYVFKMIA